MIYDYEIRKEHGEETLYLYLDLDHEFAKLKRTEKKRRLSEMIGDFLKEKDIKFDGKKIAIISGGLLVATLMTKAPNISKYDTTNYNYQNTVVMLANETNSEFKDFQKSLVIDQKNQTDEKVNQVTESKKDTVSQDKTQSQNNKTQSNNSNSNTNTSTSSTKKKPTTSSTNKNPATSQTTPPKNEPVDKPASSNQTNPNPQTPTVDTNTYVTIKRTNGSIIKLELEEYIVGVVGAEMPASFDTEALKAQAVIARTYAMKALERGTTLTDNSSTQNYKSDDQLRAMWGSSYNTYYQKIKNAVQATKGKYLTYNGALVDAVYHSTSNGKTEDAKYVWGNSLPYLVSVDSPYDSQNKSFLHETFISYADVSAKLGIIVTEATNIDIVSKTSGDRVEKVNFGDSSFTGVVVRNKLGLRSADFEIVPSSTGLTFKTKGYGHGVGLSQYGANGMAKSGYNYESILKHYYRGVALTQK